MKKIYFSLFALLLMGGGCANSPATPAPSVNTSMPADESELGSSTFEYTEDAKYTLTLPNGWFGIKSFEDFDGYGPQEEFLSYDIPGKSRLFFYEPAGEELLYLFAIMAIDLKDKPKMSNYPTEKFLGSNETSAFYGGVIEKTGPWSYLYDGRQDRYAEPMKDISGIFTSFKLK